MNKVMPANKEFVRRAGISNWCSCCWLLAAVLAFTPPNVFAFEDPTLFTVQVPLDPEEDNPRATAYKKGLWEIVVRVTGSELPAETPKASIIQAEIANKVETILCLSALIL